MEIAIVILMLLAVISFLVATFNVPTSVNTIALGLLFWSCAVIIPLIDAL